MCFVCVTVIALALFSQSHHKCRPQELKPDLFIVKECSIRLLNKNMQQCQRKGTIHVLLQQRIRTFPVSLLSIVLYYLDSSPLYIMTYASPLNGTKRTPLRSFTEFMNRTFTEITDVPRIQHKPQRCN